MEINLNAPINPDWKKYLIKYTSDIDMLHVVQSTGIGFHTLRRLRLGETNVANDLNKKAITELAELAVKNAKERKEEVTNDETGMSESFKSVFDCI